MNTIEEFLTKYVAVNGPATVKLGGDPINISVEGVTEAEFGTPDIYIVNQVGVDSYVAEVVETFVFANDGGVDINLKAEPQSAMNRLNHRIVYQSSNLAVYSTNGDVLGQQRVEIEPVVDDLYSHNIDHVGTTPSPEDLGVPFTITGEEGEEPEVDPAW